MTAGTKQPTARRGTDRIIERPRLIKLLEDADARTILLLAPAGYGKTTLARQWAKTLNRSIWLTLTPAHRDVSVLALEIASLIDTANDEAARFVTQYLNTAPTSQRLSRELARSLARRCDAGRLPWIVLDDYHELASTPEAETFVETLHSHTRARFLIASRLRPAWMSSRLAVYGEVHEVPRDRLAMDEEESRRLMGEAVDRNSVAAQAEGWPAVLALAARAPVDARRPGNPLPGNLYEYLLEELYESTPKDIRKALGQMALAPDLSGPTLSRLLGDTYPHVIAASRELGFLSDAEDETELHPLVRAFLLQKLSSEPKIDAFVRPAVEACVQRERWEKAFELIARFSLMDLVEPVLEAAYAPLVTSGRVATLATFTKALNLTAAFPPPVVELVEAEVALRDGAVQLAARIAERVRTALPEDHAFRSKASAIAGQSYFIQGRLSDAEVAYRDAYACATCDEDEAVGLRGWALASVQGESADSQSVVDRLAERSHRSPLDLLRYRTVELALSHFGGGMPTEVCLDEEFHVMAQVEDPRARTSFACLAAYVAGIRAEYERASGYIAAAAREIDSYDLDFARPHALWINALVALGLRQFAKAGRYLDAVDYMANGNPLSTHMVNGRLLRARLLLQTGQPQRALMLVGPLDADVAAIPSIPAEYIATRAVALALVGPADLARATADAATTMSSAVEVKTLADVAITIAAIRDGDFSSALVLWQSTTHTNAWDALLTGVRACPELASALAEIDEVRPALEALYGRSNDLGLARKAGLRIHANRRPEDALSPRELEVLDLLSQGYRNEDVAKALVISLSTTKVHVRHILEKLGARTRSEAVARLRDLDL